MVDLFIERLPGRKILEVGCGPGFEAAQFLTSGLEYFGCDASSAMLEIARARNPLAQFQQVSIEELYQLELDGPFDGIWANAVLLHIAKSKMLRALHLMRQLLVPGGLLFISLQEGEGEGLRAGTSWGDVSVERYFALWSQSEFLETAYFAEFSARDLHVTVEPNAGKRWLNFFLQKK
jgi:SAM-dependent methyltransferase